MTTTRWLWVVVLPVLGTAGCGDDVGGGDAEAADAEADGEPEGGDADADGDAEVEVAGRCGDGIVQSTEECDDANDVVGDGCDPDCRVSCHTGVECGDGIDCTADRCAPVAGGFACTHEPDPAFCLIDGECVADGTADPDNSCRGCDAAASADGWSAVAPGTSCTDDLFCNGEEVCNGAGACIAIGPGCPDDPCVAECDEATDTCLPAAAGTACRAAAGDCDFEETCDGTTLLCPRDELVAAGVVCRAAIGPCDLDEACSGDAAECPADVVVSEGTACDDGNACSLVDACDALGACAGFDFVPPPAVQPLLPQNGSVTGSLLAPATFYTLRPMFRWQEGPWDGCPTPSFELQVDDSCTPADLAGCGFPSPELDETGLTGISYRPLADLPTSAVAPVGARYCWRIRACRGTACSAWSAVWYFDLGRALRDFNGDGYSDVVVGAPGQDGTGTDEGAVFVYYGSATGAPTVPSVSLTNPSHAVDGGFGLSAASAGDVNGDGFADLVVGAPGQDAAVSNEGRAFVYDGAAAGLPTSPSAILDNPAAQAEGQFGVAVAGAGDVNGDGFADLIVGAHRQDGAAVDQGFAWVFAGSAAGISTTPVTTLPDPGEQLDAQFGRSVGAAGDLNADGFADVVVGAPFQDGVVGDEGYAFVYLGSAAGVPTLPSVTLVDPFDQSGAHFGWSVSTGGDINVNGFSELLVGAPLQANGTVGEGNVFVYYGTPTGVPTAPLGAFDNPGAQDGSFGFAAASAGDVNGDVNPDVAIGALYQDAGATDEGNAFVFLGCYCGVIHTSPASSTLDNPDNQAGGLFGQAVSGAGDVNGDGFADLVVGALAQDGAAANEGLAYVYHGSVTGIPPTPTTTLANPADQAGGMFGSSVD